jgi:hypothetical protein
VFLEITVKNKAPNGNIDARTLFLTVIYRETYGNYIF